MLDKNKLVLICRETSKIGYRCVGEQDGEKIYKVEYETVSYYLDEDCFNLYIVYNDNFNDYERETFDLGVHKVMKHFKMLKEDF